MGYFLKQWGHFLVDGIGRFWPLSDKKFDSYKVVFLKDKFSKIDGSYLEFLNYLTISKDRLIDVQVPTQFDEVLIPSLSYDTIGNFSPEHIRMINFIVENAHIEDISVPDKVYLTRTKFARHKEVGEKDIEAFFAANGYTVFSPEKLPVRNQIALFRKSAEIVCVNGTIPLNVLFARPELKLTVLNKTSIKHTALLRACNFTGVEPVYIDVYYEPFKKFPENIGIGPFWISITDNLIRYMSDSHMKFNINVMTLRIKHMFNWMMYAKNIIKYYLRKTCLRRYVRYIKSIFKKE